MLDGNDKWEKCIYLSGILHMRILLNRTLKILEFVFIVGNTSFADTGILGW